MTIVILGGGIDDGKLPEQVKKRLDKAINVSKERGVDRFLVCGRWSFLFTDSETPSTTEARLMKKYLINQGVNENNIFLEEKSMDTISNAYYAKTEYFLPEKEKGAIVISSNYHIPRVKYIFEKTFGEEYSLEFIGIETDNSQKLLKRQERLLKEMRKLTSDMKNGDHEFLKTLFFNADYYKRKRPAWVKNKTSKGKIK
ncbi:MAG: YdcF family protein [Patescibacteria group bacterium]